MAIETQPADQARREQFITGLERNFSVIAPAGVGKTKAIVDRVVAIATGDEERARDWLPRLVVVTYTKKAADEMHQRARNAIIERRVGLPVLTQFNRAFFGTIHSFCVRLLRTHGHVLGLPGQVEAVEDDEALWAAFLRQSGVLAPDFPTAGKMECLRFQPLEAILALARTVRREHASATVTPLSGRPTPRTDALLRHQGKGASKSTIERSQESVRRWQAQCATDAPFIPLPENESKSADFCELWENAFGPLQDWLKQASWQIALSVAADYRTYRQAQGQLTYDDQIDLAYELVRDPRAGAALRGEEYRVILDEAQDTDPAQFGLLLELARPANSRGIWLETGGAPPAPGRFCMVGDPQQSIYGSRADLAFYQTVRERLRSEAASDEINFDVTFRCDQAIIDGVNEIAAPILHGHDGQAAFFPLTARPDAGPGQVVRFDPPVLPPREEDAKYTVNEIALHEARALAAWIKKTGPGPFGARTWSDVAILCPRRRWIDPLEQALREQDLLPQIHSDRAIRGDSPAYAWLAGLCAVLADPKNGFELAGVLREIFGIADDDLARFTGGDGARLRIDEPVASDTAPGEALAALHAIWQQARRLPLRDAIHVAVEATGLRIRLETIGVESRAVRQELDSLLALASVAESGGAGWPEFARQLREQFDGGLPARPVQPDAVQLITCHKAKGLQWEAVILPMLFRPVSSLSEYPRIIPAGPGRPPRVVLSRSDLGDAAEYLEQRGRQELQRLLYVALTRPKKTLVLVDDRDLFARKKPNGSLADIAGLMRLDGSVDYRVYWENLPRELEAPVLGQLPSPPAAAIAMPQMRAEDFPRAVSASAAGATRVLPYALAERAHEAREERRDEATPSAEAEAARAYGIWWHGFMETIDWRAIDDTSAAEHLARCPQPARGQREWLLLRESPLLRELVEPTAVRHHEMPFVFPRTEREWTEGVMDLALFDPAKNRWTVLDWKTNFVAPDAVESLRELYAPQLNAYADALQTLTGVPVRALVYSTCCGRVVEIRP